MILYIYIYIYIYSFFVVVFYKKKKRKPCCHAIESQASKQQAILRTSVLHLFLCVSVCVLYRSYEVGVLNTSSSPFQSLNSPFTNPIQASVNTRYKFV